MGAEGSKAAGMTSAGIMQTRVPSIGQAPQQSKFGTVVPAVNPLMTKLNAEVEKQINVMGNNKAMCEVYVTNLRDNLVKSLQTGGKRGRNTRRRRNRAQ
jgi:hypothetical protein